MGILNSVMSLFVADTGPTPPQALPPGKMRVHFLAGTFATREAAETYCYFTEGNTPEQLTFEQPDAFIDTRFVEVIFGDHSQRLSEFLSASALDRILRLINTKNTLVNISEDAFGGLPYNLTSNAHLAYLGHELVDI